jgi:hypothetical protein
LYSISRRRIKSVEERGINVEERGIKEERGKRKECLVLK